MNKKIVPIIIAVVIIAGGAGFFAGMKYGQSKNLATKFAGPNMQNLSEADRQKITDQFRGNRAGQNGANFVNGEIISRDDKSLTIKLRDNGSKIVFFSDTAKISKTIVGSLTDLIIGETVMISGNQNSDGSLTAVSIQLNPNINQATSTEPASLVK